MVHNEVPMLEQECITLGELVAGARGTSGWQQQASADVKY